MMIGMQECGSDKQGARVHEHYIAVSGGPDESGRIACELWVAKKVARRQG